jgi:hypothetical protein
MRELEKYSARDSSLVARRTDITSRMALEGLLANAVLLSWNWTCRHLTFEHAYSQC